MKRTIIEEYFTPEVKSYLVEVESGYLVSMTPGSIEDAETEDWGTL